MPIGGRFGKSGVPDFICCYKGKFIGLECKAGKGQPTALQKLEMGRIEAAGGLTLVVREDTLDILKQMLRSIE
jgi:hypothetical protein